LLHSSSSRSIIQALALSPGDPVTCDLLKLVLDDVSTQITAQVFPFPGLPPRIIDDLDRQVAELNADILTGADPTTESGRKPDQVGDVTNNGIEEEEENTMAMQTRSEEGIEMSLEEEGDGSEGETMDMTGE